MKEIMDKLNAKKPRPPKILYQKELDKTSWKLRLTGSWKQALINRKNGLLEMSKKVFEKRKIQESKQYRAISWLSKLAKAAAYLAMASAVLTVAGPMLAMNYISE